MESFMALFSTLCFVVRFRVDDVSFGTTRGERGVLDPLGGRRALRAPEGRNWGDVSQYYIGQELSRCFW